MVVKEIKTRKNYVLPDFLSLFLVCLGLYFTMDSCKERNIDIVGSIHLIVSKYSSRCNDNILLILKQCFLSEYSVKFT